jgi:hypothetical protein
VVVLLELVLVEIEKDVAVVEEYDHQQMEAI